MQTLDVAFPVMTFLILMVAHNSDILLLVFYQHTIKIYVDVLNLLDGEGLICGHKKD